MNIDVLFENKHYIVINKPAGLVVHYDGKTKEPTLTDWIAEKYPETTDVGEPLTLTTGEVIKRPGIVHRIDRETSGVLVIARTQEAFLTLKKQFQDKDVHKIYHAFVYGNVKKDEDTIDRPIGRSRKDFRKWSAQRFARGELREAITDYRVLERDLTRGKEVTFVEVKPRTGRTHQIRVHFKAINHPIVGDSLYAPNHKPLLGFERTALHAHSVDFKDVDGKMVSVSAPYPQDFAQAVDMIKKAAE